MDLCFDKTIYILGVISAFVQKKKLLHALLLGKSTPKTNILDEFQRDLFPLLYCMVMDVVFGDFIFT
jgi:hypothetical protein